MLRFSFDNGGPRLYSTNLVPLCQRNCVRCVNVAGMKRNVILCDMSARNCIAKSNSRPTNGSTLPYTYRGVPAVYVISSSPRDVKLSTGCHTNNLCRSFPASMLSHKPVYFEFVYECINTHWHLCICLFAQWFTNFVHVCSH